MHPGHHPQNPVRPLLELGPDQAETAGVGLQPRGVRGRADIGRPRRSGSRDHETSRQHPVATFLRHRFRLTAEQRLIEFQPIGNDHRRVHRNLITRVQFEDVVEDHRLHRNLGQLTAAHDARTGGGEDGQPVQRPLGPQLLPDADRGIDREHESEQAVLNRPHDKHHRKQRTQDGVEAGEDIRAQDLPGRPPGQRRRRVDLARKRPGAHRRPVKAAGARLTSLPGGSHRAAGRRRSLRARPRRWRPLQTRHGSSGPTWRSSAAMRSAGKGQMASTATTRGPWDGLTHRAGDQLEAVR